MRGPATQSTAAPRRIPHPAVVRNPPPCAAPSMPNARVNLPGPAPSSGSFTPCRRPRINSMPDRLHRAEQHEARPSPPLHQNVEQPVDAIVHVHIGITGPPGLDKRPGAWAEPRVAGRVAHRIIRLRFHNPTHTAMPHEMAADQSARTSHRILLEKVLPDSFHFPIPSPVPPAPQVGNPCFRRHPTPSGTSGCLFQNIGHFEIFTLFPERWIHPNAIKDSLGLTLVHFSLVLLKQMF